MRVLLAALVVLGCGGGRATRPPSARPEPGPITVVASLELSSLQLPEGELRDFALCPPGLAMVPINGGVVLAGWSAWASLPEEPAVQSLGCDLDGNILFVRGGHLWRREAGKSTELMELPAGDWHVVATVGRPAWIWGQSSEGAWTVLRYDPGEGLQQVAALSTPIGAVAAVGLDGALVAVDRRLVLYGPGGATTVLIELDQAPDGLAMLPGGNVVVSTIDGLVTIDQTGASSVVAVGVHGALLAQYLTVYVLSREHHAVLRLSPP